MEHSKWAVPIVPVPKKDGTLRICGDFKFTVNPYLDVDQHPLPKPTELFACLTGGQRFTKLDLSSAYQQLLLDEESSKLVTINACYFVLQGFHLEWPLLQQCFSALWISFCKAYPNLLPG